MENASQGRMVIYFGNCVRVIEQRVDISFCEVLELQKYSSWDTTIEHRFLFSDVNGLNKFK